MEDGHSERQFGSGSKRGGLVESWASDALPVRPCHCFSRLVGARGQQGGRADDAMEWPWTPSALLELEDAITHCPLSTDLSNLQWLAVH